MKVTSYTVQGDACALRVIVAPTMEALGDQPWQVLLYDLGDGLCLNSDSYNLTEASSPLEAVTTTVREWLENQGLPTNFKIR